MSDMLKINRNKTIGVSGPRPTKYGYSDSRLEKINAILYSEITELIQAGFDSLIFGGAPGFDLICARAVIRIREDAAYSDFRLICVLPFKNFNESQYFDMYWRDYYNEVIPHCITVNAGRSIGYYPGCFKKRNYYMIDNSDTLICLYDGGRGGGTGQTYHYGVSKGRQIINIQERVDRDGL